jgi:hypothetical protein
MSYRSQRSPKAGSIARELHYGFRGLPACQLGHPFTSSVLRCCQFRFHCHFPLPSRGAEGPAFHSIGPFGWSSTLSRTTLSRPRALLALEVCKVEGYPFSDDQEPTRADWELYIAEVARNIMDEQSPKQLFLVGPIGSPAGTGAGPEGGA